MSHVGGSSMVFTVVNAALGGLLPSTIAGALAAPLSVVIPVGTLYGLAYFFISAARGRAGYYRTWHTHAPHNPTP